MPFVRGLSVFGLEWSMSSTARQSSHSWRSGAPRHSVPRSVCTRLSFTSCASGNGTTRSAGGSAAAIGVLRSWSGAEGRLGAGVDEGPPVGCAPPPSSCRRETGVLRPVRARGARSRTRHGPPRRPRPSRAPRAGSRRGSAPPGRPRIEAGAGSSPRARAGASSWSRGRGAATRPARPAGEIEWPRLRTPQACEPGRRPAARARARRSAPRPRARSGSPAAACGGRAPGTRHLAPGRRPARPHRGHGPPHRRAPRSGGSRRAGGPSSCTPARRGRAAQAELQEPHPRSGRGQALRADDLPVSGHGRRPPNAQAGRPTTPTAPPPASAPTPASRPRPSDQVPTSICRIHLAVDEATELAPVSTGHPGMALLREAGPGFTSRGQEASWSG